MAEIQVQDLMKDYETEIGRLNGVIIQQRQSHAAEMREVYETVRQLQAQLNGEELPLPDGEAAGDGSGPGAPELSVVPDPPKRPARKAAAKKAAKKAPQS